MRQRPTALGFASLLALLAALNVGTSAEAVSVARQCRQACRDEIAACVGAGGHFRACRKSVLGRCRREGVAVCEGQANIGGDPGVGGLGRHKKSTTTTTTTITTTTTQPPITTTTITSATTTTLAGGGGSPATGLHY